MKQTTGATAVRWTAKEVVVGKTFWFLILTILLSAVLILGVNSAITYVMHLNRGNSLFVYNYGLGIFSLVLVLPAGAFVILLLKLAGNWKLSRLTPEEAAVRHARDVKFKWSPLYCLPIGYGALVLMYLLVSMPLMELVRGSSNPICAFLIPLVLIFGPLVAVFLAVPAFNRAMIRRTGTNQALVRELWAGLHNDQIPQKYQNQRDLTAISLILLKGQVCNVRGGGRSVPAPADLPGHRPGVQACSDRAGCGAALSDPGAAAIHGPGVPERLQQHGAGCPGLSGGRGECRLLRLGTGAGQKAEVV